jgi:hypothetical protein
MLFSLVTEASFSDDLDPNWIKFTSLVVEVGKYASSILKSPDKVTDEEREALKRVRLSITGGAEINHFSTTLTEEYEFGVDLLSRSRMKVEKTAGIQLRQIPKPDCSPERKEGPPRPLQKSLAIGGSYV